MSTPVALVVAVALLAGNAFFVATEFSLIASRRSQIEPAAQAGSRLAKTTLRALEQMPLMIAGIQLGVTLCSLVLGAVAEPSVSRLIEPLFEAVHVPEQLVHVVGFLIALVAVAFFHVVFGEMVPKNVTLAGPDRAVLLLAPPMYAVVRVLKPLVIALDATAKAVLRSLRIEPKDEVSSTFTREEVAALVEESRGEGLLEDDEYDRLAGALGFTEKTVEAVLLPVSDLEVVRLGAAPADIEDRCAATGFSRFPVANGDDLIGYVHIKDVLESDEERRLRPLEEKRVRPFATVSVDEQLHDVLETLQRKGAHLARVIDEDGATLGLATLEDVIEELVGEIRDAAHD